ncbi:MAG TPA: helix-turn-helix transcriptional regulator [Blastocatellia bacterium]|nr:helix-turn-helix transcriptional regulator [Blastocatellia bacterium]
MNGLELKIARLLRGVKQLELSRKARISASRLSLIECGWAEASPAELAAIKRVLAISEERPTEHAGGDKGK